MSEKSEKKSFLVPLLVTVIGGIIVAMFVWWLNGERYDLRYTLSEKIPLRFGGAPEEAVQQIQIKNLSKRPVEQIQVTLPPRLTAYDVLKSSQGDKVDHFKNEEAEEFDYPALPPQGSFTIIFKTLGASIANNEIHVSYSKGQATNALESGSSPATAFGIASVCGFGLWLLLGIFSLRSIEIDSLNWQAEYESEKLLKKKKPFFLNADKWDEIRRKAISNIGSREYLNRDDVENSAHYNWLSQEKPAYITEEEWRLIRVISTNHIRDNVNDCVSGDWIPAEKVLKYLRLKKPNGFDATAWRELNAKLQEHYVSKRIADRSDDDLVTKLEEAKPDEIDLARWAKSQTQIAERLAVMLYNTSIFKESPLGYLNSHNLQVLQKEIRDDLIKKAYELQMKKIPNLNFEEKSKAFLENEKPAWMAQEDYLRLKEAAERTVQLSKDEIFYHLLREIVSGIHVPDGDLNSLRSDEKEKLLRIRNELNELRESKQRVVIESERIMKESDQLKNDRKVVLNQLNKLNDLFTDPSSVDRIESYDNPFAPGNFEALKKLSQLLKERQ